MLGNDPIERVGILLVELTGIGRIDMKGTGRVDMTGTGRVDLTGIGRVDMVGMVRSWVEGTTRIAEETCRLGVEGCFPFSRSLCLPRQPAQHRSTAS